MLFLQISQITGFVFSGHRPVFLPSSCPEAMRELLHSQMRFFDLLSACSYPSATVLGYFRITYYKWIIAMPFSM